MNLRKIRLFPILTLWLCLSPGFSANADSFSFFNEGINYWPEEDKEAPKKKEIPDSQRKDKKKNFDWDKYMDPESDEFFKEGNYIPPAPFMEFYRRPTKENAQKWDAYLKKRNFIHKRALLAAQRYLDAPGFQSKPNEIKPLSSIGEEEISKVFKNKWVVFYFDKNCSFCKQMYPAINKLAFSGVQVQAVRLDSEGGPISGLRIPWEKAKPGEAEKMKISVTPTTLVISDQTKKVKKVTGVRSVEDILKLGTNI